MDLSLDRPGNYLYVRRVSARAITVVDREFTASFLLSPERAVERWPVAASAELDDSHVQAILDLKPEVVLLGTGERQVFPAAAFMAALLRQGVGVEVMDNAAAARTYDLLAGESRRVVAAFILPA
ncbi:Mth938-like domain-containing protein [Dyella sedimenti]|uniref:Mth938-like domain-containing protein n=1 Tax=Dyella sedimenti TaxID=2919947 RepID=UPI001FAA8AAC|nr:Mth938-like domain-containing protein [Dyella sedimenti]